MILDPTTDAQCLGQLTQLARELAPTTLIHMVAARLGSAAAATRWLQSLPQSDDDGDELFRYISCDVPQRVRLLPDDPNCFERAFAALTILEVLDPATQRMLVTIERPLRHTGIVERRDGRWQALDLFPRRNFDWGEFGKDILQGAHQYVGKPVLKFYLGDQGGKIADTLGEQENKLIGRDKKPAKKSQPDPGASVRPAVVRPVIAMDAAKPKEEKNGEEKARTLEGTGRTGAADHDGRSLKAQTERWGGWG